MNWNSGAGNFFKMSAEDYSMYSAGLILVFYKDMKLNRTYWDSEYKNVL